MSRVEVLRSHAEVVRGEQHLPCEQLVLPEDRADPCHEQWLPDRGDGLEQTRRWVGSRNQRGQARRDRSRTHEHDLVAPSARWQLRCTASNAVSSGSPASDVIDDVPIFTTTVDAIQEIPC